MIKQSILHDIVAIAKRLDQRQFVNTYEGNISVRDEGLIYITPTTVNKAFLTESQIAVLKEDTLEQIAGDNKASSELLLHAKTYRIRPEINSIVHAHPVALTAYAFCGKNLELDGSPEMLIRFKKIPCAPYGRLGTDAIFDVAEGLIKENNVVLLGNHGVVSVGVDLSEALARIESAEALARISLCIKTMDATVKPLPREEVEWINSL